MLRNSFGNRVLGPEYPVISRIRNLYHKNLLLKIEKERSIIKAKMILDNIIEKNTKSFRFFFYSLNIMM